MTEEVGWTRKMYRAAGRERTRSARRAESGAPHGTRSDRQCARDQPAGGRNPAGGAVGQQPAELTLVLWQQRCRQPTIGISNAKAHRARNSRLVNIIGSLFPVVALG